MPNPGNNHLPPQSRAPLKAPERVPLKFKSLIGNVAAVLTTALIVALASGYLLWAFLGEPKLSPRDTRPMGTEELYDGVKIALSVVAGIGGVVALVVAYRRQSYTEAESSREDTRLYNERLRTAAEQLGVTHSAGRLAGVYALASLADDWHGGRQTCINILCAYLRKPYTPPGKQPTAGSLDEALYFARREEQQVRLSLIQTIREHLCHGETFVSWQGYNFDFVGATFDDFVFDNVNFAVGRLDFGSTRDTMIFTHGKVNFAGVTFTGKVNFNSATFSGGRVNFTGATFSDGAFFAGAKFTNGTIDFGATFTSRSGLICVAADFDEKCTVDFSKAKLPDDMTFAELIVGVELPQPGVKPPES